MQQFYCKPQPFALGLSFAATPLFSPVPGTYTGTQNVSITSTTPGSTIHYTLDGSTPTIASPVYSSPIVVTASETIYAIATAAGFQNSLVGGGNYIIQLTNLVYSAVGYGAPLAFYVPNGAVTPPLPNGVAVGNLLLLLTGTHLGTINPPAISGWTWLTSSYTNHSLALYGRIATGSGDAPSVNWGTSNTVFAAAMTAAYTGNPTTLTGIVNNFASLQSNSTNTLNYGSMNVTADGCLVVAGGIMNLDATTNEADGIWGQIGGSTGFTVESQSAANNSYPALVYNDWIQVSQTNLTSNAQTFSVTQGSAQSTGAFSISLLPGLPPPVGTPTFSPPAGTYSSTQIIVLSCATSGASIYYTTDGSTPTFPITGTTQLYTTSLTVSANETIKAIGVKGGLTTSVVATAVYTINASASAYKFNPGDYAMSLQYQHNVTLANATADINNLVANKLNSWAGGKLNYVMGATWSLTETGAQTANPTLSQSILNTQYPGFAVWEQIFNYLQQQSPGAHMGIVVMANQYGKSFSANTIKTANFGNGQYIPAYIANCGGTLNVYNGYGSSTTTAYPVAPIYSGSSYYGIGFNGWNGTLLTEAVPAFWNPGINQAFINFLQAASKYQIQGLGSGSSPYTGQTFDQCPLIEFLFMNDEYSYSMLAAYNPTDSGGVTVNPPNFTSAANQATKANGIAAYKLMQNAVTAAFPHTLVACNFTYSFDATSPFTTNADMAGWTNDGISQTGTSLSTIRGLALSAADTYGSDWVSPYHANPAKQGFVGIASPPMAPPVATSLTLNGIMPFFAQIQPSDYNIRLPSGVTPYSAAAIVSLAASANNSFVQATHRVWCMDDDRFQTGFYAWDNEVVPTLNGGSAVTFSSAEPTSLAGGGTTLGAGSNQVINLASFAGQGSNISTSGPGSINGSVLAVTSSSASAHQAGAGWWRTKVNVTAFTTTFTFQIPVAPPTPVYPNNNPTGFSFVVQNTTAPPGPVGFVGLFYVADANLCGSGIFATQAPSAGSNIAIKFDLNAPTQSYPANGTATPNTVGLYVNDGPFAALQPMNDLNPIGISLYSTHVMSCTVSYDGTILQMTLKDTTTNAQTRFEWPINIPTVVGANTAWVGFTGGTVPILAQNILTWQFFDGVTKFTRLTAPTFSVPAGSYTSTQNVSLSGSGSIYYTTNGQPPTTSSTLYSGGTIAISASTILQAVAVQSGFTDSFIATANYQIAAGGTPLINFPTNFAGSSGLINLIGSTQLNSGTKIRLTDTAGNWGEVGCAWYLAPVSITTFTTNFQLQFTSAAGNGMTFCIQNVAPSSTTSLNQTTASWVSGGPTTMALNSTGLGYAGPTGSNGQANAGIFQSVAVKFDLTNNTTGIFTNGALPTTPQTTITGVTLTSGHIMNVTLAYNGTTLTLTIQDATTLVSFTTNFTVNIPTQVGANTAYVGFTGSTGGSVANQDVLNWTYTTP